ncbi:MAG: bifunctional homocysteine S-methyltransferase/methylenetetrahydrofolate reductase [Terriglobia bacterium]
MKSSELQALLEKNILVCDGAMGSQLYELVGSTRCFEELNLLQPELVLRVHLNYIEAGARIIETNTFGANRLKLAPHGLAERVVAINQRAVKLAREAREVSGAAILVAGSIGPLGAGWRVAEPEAAGRARELFAEQAAALEERGVDLFILETFPDLEELVWAVEAVRGLSGLPLMAQLAYNEEGKTLGGDEARTATERLKALGVDVIGANCSIGPQAILEVLQAMAQVGDVRLSVQPNVGFPQRVGDRVLYPKATPDYFSAFAREATRSGVSVIGGCCGTTPEHIRAIAQAVRDLTPSRDARPRAAVVLEAPPPVVVQAEPASALYRKLQAGEFVISVELDPPKGVNLERILEVVEQFRNSKRVDAVDINSGTLARVGMDALLLAAAIERTGMETIPHLTTRDANIIGLQAMLLGAWAVGGIRNILAITGDPPVLGDHPEVAGVYEVDAIGLVRIIRRLNQGTDWAGKALGGSTNFAIGVAVNPVADNLDEEIDRFQQKAEAGAHFAMTQPIFDPELWYTFVNRLGSKPPIPVLIGLWPLTSHKLAVRLNNEVPGIVIPEHVQKELAQAGAAARDRGFALARELFAWARQEAAGVYIIPPFKKFEQALEVITD